MTAAAPRALLISTDLPPTRGGIQTMAAAICARSRTVAAVLGPSAPPGAGPVDDRPPTFPMPVERVPAHAGPSLARALFVHGRRHIARDRPDVVLALHPLAAPAGLTSRVPTVVFTHGGELRSRRIRLVARQVFGRAQAVVANSESTRRAAIAAGADPGRTHVVHVAAAAPPAVSDATVAARATELGGGPILLTVARLEPHKGHDAVLDALASLPPEVRAVFVGEGSAREALAARAASLGLADRVVFTGPLDDAALHATYAAAAVFVLPSRDLPSGVEGGGIALLEACAHGLPVVAGATGGIPETIAHGETGLLVDPDDPPGIARALRRVLDDRAFARAMAERARTMALRERTWDGFVTAVDGIVAAAAKERR